ncbi:MAG: lspA [Bacteroidetes bacterium]|nr:lspA [Bacteroidota bacterium]
MRVLILSTAIVLADQITKLLVKGFSIPLLGISVRGMQYGVSKPVIGDFVRLTYIENPGMAFGIDLGGKWFFSVFSIVASVAILVYLYRAREESLGFRISLALILGGALGNLIDRVFYGVFFSEGPLFYGKVVDFFDVDFFNISVFGYHLSRWPVFNIADAAVTIGVFLLLIFHRSTAMEEEPAGAEMTTEPVQSLPSETISTGNSGRDPASSRP